MSLIISLLTSYWSSFLIGAMIFVIFSKLRARSASQAAEVAETQNQTLSQNQTQNKIRERADNDDTDDDEEENDKNDYVPPKTHVDFIPFVGKNFDEEEMIARSKSFYEEMNQRRTLRFYSSKQVPVEVMENIIKTAGTSPSGAHTEPWTYVVVWLFPKTQSPS